MMRELTLIQLPYDSGRFDVRMGRGPSALIGAGIAAELNAKGKHVAAVAAHLPDGCIGEGEALVQLQRQGCAAVRGAIQTGSRPILLSGNCGPAALSAIAALGAASTGVIWFDAHGDFNTPETSPSGFLDGMGLAILVGDTWRQLATRFAEFEPTHPEHIVQIGVRDCDPEEEMRLAHSGIRRIGSQDLRQLEPALAELAQHVSRVYVHVDVDVVDVSEGRANTYACAGGLSLDELLRALEMIAAALPIAAGSITSYDPAADEDGRIGRAIPRIVERLAL
jgi:arginase